MTDYRGMPYEAIMASATYSVIRSYWKGKSWNNEEVLDAGLALHMAKARAKELQDAEHARHPGKTSWSLDVYYIQLEQADAIHRELDLRRVERCQQYEKQQELFKVIP